MISNIPHEITNVLQDSFNAKVTAFDFIAGGCINNGGRVQLENNCYFIKWNDRKTFPGMFEAEAKGLKLLHKQKAIRVPLVVGNYETEQYQFLLLEYIVSNRKQSDFPQRLGTDLAALHQVSNDFFGLDHDNYIGSLCQVNNRANNFADFFIEQRLEVQLKLAVDKHFADQSLKSKFESFYKKLPDLFPEEKPSLVHGDLWSGNVITDEVGNPCLIDPAVSFGHREADLAMTTLFGGLDPEYIDHYNEALPLIKGYEERFELYNLYPLMVHLNLFGKTYLPKVVSILNNWV